MEQRNMLNHLLNLQFFYTQLSKLIYIHGKSSFLLLFRLQIRAEDKQPSNCILLNTNNYRKIGK